MEQLTEILRIQDPKLQTARLIAVLDEIIELESKVGKRPDIFPSLESLVRSVFADAVPQQVTKNVVVHFANALQRLQDIDLFLEISNFTLQAIKQNLSTYDDADFILREGMFAKYIEAEQFSDAALILSGTNLDSTTRVFSEKEKTDILVKCAEAYLEDDASLDAEVFVNKASPFINAIDDLSLQLRYKVTYARVMDANRKFLDAAVRYYELSTAVHANIVPEELLELLGKAVTCAVLGKVGPQRVRVMTLLHKDERLLSLDQLPKYSSHSVILSKMLKEQILKKEELQVFQSTLLPHQKAITSEGYTIPEKAVMEHNMLSLSRIYENIYFSDLAAILHIDSSRAEKLAATMIVEDKLAASIDQTAGNLEFRHKSNELFRWDENIQVLCNEMTDLVDGAQELYLNSVMKVD